jgi:DUF2924 family protein
MNGLRPRRRPARASAAAVLNDELDRIAAMTVDKLRALWREMRRQEPPPALTKDLLARALAYQLQEERFGGLAPGLRKLLALFAKGSGAPVRQLKVGSVIVREHGGSTHEVLVAPDGFTWRGGTYASLSAIAQKITGVNWNGPRFFGLRGDGEPGAPDEPDESPTVSRAETSARRGSVRASAATTAAHRHGSTLRAVAGKPEVADRVTELSIGTEK